MNCPFVACIHVLIFPADCGHSDVVGLAQMTEINLLLLNAKDAREVRPYRCPWGLRTNGCCLVLNWEIYIGSRRSMSIALRLWVSWWVLAIVVCTWVVILPQGLF